MFFINLMLRKIGVSCNIFFTFFFHVQSKGLLTLGHLPRPFPSTIVPHLTPLLACRHTALTIQPSKASDCLSILNLLFCSRALFHAHIFFLKELLNEVSTSCILRFKWDRFWKLTCIFNLIQQGRRSCVGAVSDHTACAPPCPLTLRLSGHTVGE